MIKFRVVTTNLAWAPGGQDPTSTVWTEPPSYLAAEPSIRGLTVQIESGRPTRPVTGYSSTPERDGSRASNRRHGPDSVVMSCVASRPFWTVQFDRSGRLHGAKLT